MSGTPTTPGDPSPESADGRAPESTPTLADPLTGEAAAAPKLRQSRRYEILRPHARGGLGAVFVARDLELNREVALKQILEAHADSPILRERFVLEAEVTGSLEHPGIVPIYGLGADEQGRPFYAMRFIRGDTLREAITRFHATDGKPDARTRALELRKLLRRFLDVCNAIDYAHGRGVLHRDIKPDNVILGSYGETLVVDWGLAKLQGRSGTSPATAQDEGLFLSSFSSTTQTVMGTTVGTPAFMSPEQARGDLDALGPASDVYSLGATLYYLLTGKPPIEGAAKQALDAVLHGRFERPRRHDPSIDRALEAMCLRAMALAPAERYASVRTLADDVERWLADESVSAHRDPWSTRLRRWGRRHRTLASSLGVGALTVFLALAISTYVIEGERGRAEENFRKARAAVDSYFTTVSESTLLDVPGLQPLRKELLDAALEYYKDFLVEHGSDPSVSKEAAAASFRAGWIAATVGQPQEAVEHYRTAARLYEELARDEPDVAEHRRNLARCFGAIGLVALDGLEDSVAWHRRALELREELARQHPEDAIARNDVARTRGNIAGDLRNLGRPEEALAELDAAVGIGEELVKLPLDRLSTTEEFTRRNDPWALVREDLARIHRGRADVLRDIGKREQALEAWERGHALYLELVEGRPGSLDYVNLLGLGEIAGGALYMTERRFEDSYRLLDHARQLFTDLAAANPSVLGYRHSLAETQLALSRPLVELNRSAEALELTEAALANMQHVLAAEPNPGRQTLYGQIAQQRGALLMSAGRAREALDILRSACDIQRSVVRAQPESVYHASTLASMLASLGRAAAEAGEREEAREAFLDAVEVTEGYAAAYPGQLYNQACYLALAIPVCAPSERDRLTARAIDVLRRAIDGGYDDYANMAADEDLDALRERADFKQLLASISPGRRRPRGRRRRSRPGSDSAPSGSCRRRPHSRRRRCRSGSGSTRSGSCRTRPRSCRCRCRSATGCRPCSSCRCSR
jgi:serine/threonine-protein kinase